jgi:hypothetical protein
MIRLLIALIIVALLLTKVSQMLGGAKSEDPRAPEEAILGEAYEPYTRAQQFSDKDYEEALDKQRAEMDKKIDGG